MKKFFNDHVGLCFAVAAIMAGVALYFALNNRKRLGNVEAASTLTAEAVNTLSQKVNTIPDSANPDAE